MTERPRTANRALRLVCLCLLALAAYIGPGVCSAYGLGADPESENFVLRFGEFGTGAGQTGIPFGMGASPTTGDIYVSDWTNNRINEFSPWGEFIRAFGWGVQNGSPEFQVCTTSCQAGLPGQGAGQFDLPWGVVVDHSGDVYVSDSKDLRVQKFTAMGQFLLSFGGEVDKTEAREREKQEANAEPVTVTIMQENVCTAASGDECGAGTEGGNPGQFSIGVGDIALGPDGTVFVADQERIEGFEAEGAFKSEVKLPGKELVDMTVDPTTGDYYVIYAGEQDVYKLSPTGALLGDLEVRHPRSLAVDSAGDVFVRNLAFYKEPGYENEYLLEFGPGGNLVAEFGEIQEGPEKASVYGLGTNAAGDLYVSHHDSESLISFITAYGPPPVSFEPPPPVAPTIESEYALSVDLDSAVLQARINPHFWSDTTYYLEYGNSDCEAGGCAAQPVAPGSRLTSRVVDQSVPSQGVPLTGLTPNTTYHYRFVSLSGGGGPVFGPDQTFTTAPAFVADVGCPNQSLRTGFSAPLPDCRAYELVSPIEKNGGDIINLFSLRETKNGLNQSSINGEKFTYSADRAFANSPSGLYVNQYMSGRNPASGWSTESISAPVRPGPGVGDLDFETEYKYFTPDLSNGWLAPPPELPLAPGVVEGAYSLYRHDNSTGGFEALISGVGREEQENPPELEGFSSDGNLAVFQASAKLTSDASTKFGDTQIYERSSSGEIQLVSVLPNGMARDESSTVGAVENLGSSGWSVKHAVSEDGSRVYWSGTDSSGFNSNGKLFLRLNADREQSAMSGEECLEEEKACTIVVSGKDSRFAAASADGSKAIYLNVGGSRNEELDEFDLEERSSTPIAGKVMGVAGTSEDLSYVYFVSTEALVHGAHAGAPNLYVHHEKANSLIATLSPIDVALAVTDITMVPQFHAARVTPDGSHIAFISTSHPTGYDNIDAITNKPDSEVYVYDAQTQRLACVSCDRTGARPSGREVAPPDTTVTQLPTAATIPGGENQLYASRVLSEDGRRLFFESYVPLVPRDTNGTVDVYEWEAPGTGSCSTESSSFSSANEGCVELISSGESPQGSEILDATPNGSDVFFTTTASLLPQDPGSVDVYDARVDGGFPAPAAPPASCEGEACQGAPSPPDDRTPASATFSGPGSLLGSTNEAAGAKKRTVVKKTVAQSRARKLAGAVKRCRTKSGRKARKSCEAAARRRYATRSQMKISSKGRGK